MNEEASYKCPKCGCEFTAREGEGKTCRRSECGCEVKTGKAAETEGAGCPCCG
ncbi:MAG: hypothetical protein KGJ55_05825 [Gammaproteobacteria bacterium]|nr:hypothetical protein [Gammaproteobacteria bacterium]